MKRKFIGLAWAACVLLGGSGCSKQEIKREDKTSDGIISSDAYSTDYRFFRNGISSVDIGESKKVLLYFRNCLVLK